jgi:transposase
MVLRPSGSKFSLRSSRIRSARSIRINRWSDVPCGVPVFIDQVLRVIEVQTEEIALADKQLKELALEDPVCIRLMTVPGVGPVTSIRFVAALDGVSRFPSAHAVQCYLGLVPGENSSSQRKQCTSITKAGPPRVRWALAGPLTSCA